MSVAREVADVIVEAIEASGAEEPRFAVLELPVHQHPDRPRGPVYGAVGTERFRARAALLSQPEEALQIALHWRPKDVPRLAFELDPTLRERVLGGYPKVVLDLARELLEDLNARDWRALLGQPDFVVVARVDDDPAISRAVLGDSAWEAFRATLETEPRPDLGDVRATSRDHIREIARRLRIPDALSGPAAVDAAWAVVLEPGGSGLSRVGGPALLPPGVAWPRAEGRPLSHLASIALRELPADVEGRDLLPRDGVLAFFADLSEEGEFYEPLGPEGLPHDGRVALLHAAGDETVEVPPPHDLEVPLELRRVQLVQRLQIRGPDWNGDAIDRELLMLLAEVTNGGWEGGAHQLLGHPDVVQEDPREPGDVALLHLSDDSELGFDFLDAGDVLVYGPTDALRAGAWDRLTWWPSSC